MSQPVSPIPQLFVGLIEGIWRPVISASHSIFRRYSKRSFPQIGPSEGDQTMAGSSTGSAKPRSTTPRPIRGQHGLLGQVLALRAPGITPHLRQLAAGVQPAPPPAISARSPFKTGLAFWTGAAGINRPARIFPAGPAPRGDEHLRWCLCLAR